MKKRLCIYLHSLFAGGKRLFRILAPGLDFQVRSYQSRHNRGWQFSACWLGIVWGLLLSNSLEQLTDNLKMCKRSCIPMFPPLPLQYAHNSWDVQRSPIAWHNRSVATSKKYYPRITVSKTLGQYSSSPPFASGEQETPTPHSFAAGNLFELWLAQTIIWRWASKRLYNHLWTVTARNRCNHLAVGAPWAAWQFSHPWCR